MPRIPPKPSPGDLEVDPADLWAKTVNGREEAVAELGTFDSKTKENSPLEEVDYNGQAAYVIPDTSWNPSSYSTVERANYIAYLKYFKPWVKPWTVQGSKAVVIPKSVAALMPQSKWDDLAETILKVRDSYPLVSDDIHSQLESDLKDEAWDDHAGREFREFLIEHLQEQYEDQVDRDGIPVLDKVEAFLEDPSNVYDVFREMDEHGSGDNWDTGDGAHVGLRHHFYVDLARNMDDVKKFIDDKLYPANKAQLKFPFADEVVEALLNERGFEKKGGCSVAALALAASLLESHDYSCVLARLPKDLADDILAWGEQQIPEQSLFVDEDKKGREDEIHVTVKYGLSDPMPSEDLKRLFIETAPFEVSLAPITLFRNGKYDVVKLDVASPQLHELNQRITARTPCPGNTFPEYHPHVTLAYVKPGTCDRLEGVSPWDSQVKMGVSDIGQEGKFEVDQVVFSSSVGVKKLFSLGPKKEPEEVEESEEAGLVDPREIAHKACLFGRDQSLRWMRRHVGRRVVTRVEIRRIKPGTIWHEGELRICFDRGEAAQTTFCSYEVLKMSIRQWRNLYGAELYIDGQPAGKVSYTNPALADTP